MKNLEELLSELVAVEQMYIDKLSVAVEGYLVEFRKKDPLVPVPKELQDKEVFVFGNIEEIYHWHKDFLLPALVKNRHSPAELGKAFLSSESQFHMYVKNCCNKNMSEDIVNKYSEYFNNVRKSLGHKVALNLLLIIPFQRLVQYKCVLSQIVDHLKELQGDWQSLSEVHTMIESVLKNVNDFTVLQSIKNYNGDIFVHGKLICHGILMCKYDGKEMRSHVFLLKRLLIFTDRRDSERVFGMPTFKCEFQIPINKLQLEELPNKRFTLKSNDPSLQDMNVVCSAEDEVAHVHWLQHIKNQIAELE